MRASEADAPTQAASTAEVASEAADADDGVEVTTVEVTGLDDPAAPLGMDGLFVAPAGEAVGDEIYLTPFVLMQMDENPFQRPTRTFPVDFAYPFSRTYVASVELPEGFVPEEVPAPLRMTLPGRAVSYTRVMSVDLGRLTVRADLTVSQARIEAEEYPALRQLYDEIVAAEAEALVLVRATDAAAGAAESPAAASGEPTDGEPTDGDAASGGAAGDGAPSGGAPGGDAAAPVDGEGGR